MGLHGSLAATALPSRLPGAARPRVPLPRHCLRRNATPYLQAVLARLEVCMRAVGLSLTPPPAVDFDSVPLERLLPVRTPRAGTLGLPPSHQVRRCHACRLQAAPALARPLPPSGCPQRLLPVQVPINPA